MFENLSAEERAEVSYFLNEMAEAHLQMLYAVHGLRAVILAERAPGQNDLP